VFPRREAKGAKTSDSTKRTAVFLKRAFTEAVEAGEVDLSTEPGCKTEIASAMDQPARKPIGITTSGEKRHHQPRN